MKQYWQQLPDSIRRPVVFFVGVFLIIAAGLTGWLPGPGGIPLFLLGIAVLASEFEWARKLRDHMSEKLKPFGDYFKKHRETATAGLILIACSVVTIWIYYFTR